MKVFPPLILAATVASLILPARMAAITTEKIAPGVVGSAQLGQNLTRNRTTIGVSPRSSRAYLAR